MYFKQAIKKRYNQKESDWIYEAMVKTATDYLKYVQ
jgi:hypothetical protein